MNHYELLCLDPDRPQSIWLSHHKEFTSQALTGLLDDVIRTLDSETITDWMKETRKDQQLALELGRDLDITGDVMARLEHRAVRLQVTLGPIFDRVAEEFCARYGFTRLTPTAVAVRYGSEVLLA